MRTHVVAGANHSKACCVSLIHFLHSRHICHTILFVIILFTLFMIFVYFFPFFLFSPFFSSILVALFKRNVSRVPMNSFFFLCMFLVNQRFLFRNFLLCCPSQRSARSHVPFQVATHQEIDRQLWAGETPDSNPGLQDNSLARYH
jgi:hypothetical protein